MITVSRSAAQAICVRHAIADLWAGGKNNIAGFELFDLDPLHADPHHAIGRAKIQKY